MASRLVLGSGSLAHTIAEALAARPGTCTVVTTDEARARALREAGIAVLEADPTDRDALAEFEDVAVVAVAGEEGPRNLAAARAAAAVHPAAFLLGVTGTTDPDPEAMATYADEVLDPATVTGTYLLDRVGDEGIRMRQLQRVLRDVDHLAIVTHDNPDPDAIASAVALARLAERADCEVEVCYYGDITHQENRAFVNLLGFDLRNLAPEADLSGFDGFALVDHSRPGVNDGLPTDLDVDVVIDHHPPRAPIEGRYVDLRSDVGATSTLLVDYLEHFGVEPTEAVATGLLFGIRVDTKEFTREVSPADFEAAASLFPHADADTLRQIESPSMSTETLQIIANAIGNRRREGSVLLSCVGRIGDRDALAQAAERLLELEDVVTTVVYGVMDGDIYVSARARGTDVDLGETLRDAFGRIGSAGGHADMAGAQVELGVLESVEDRDESLMEIVEAVVSERFLEALEARATQTVTGVYAPEVGSTEEYLVPDAELPGEGEAEDATGEEADGP